MAYFVWQGIDLSGKIHTGKRFATSKTELDSLLFKQEIALLSCRQARQIPFIGRSINQALKIQFFKQLTELLSAGVLLPDALIVISSQTHHVGLQDCLSHIAASVQEGNSFSQALGKYPLVFDTIMIKMAHVGEESGGLVVALTMLTEYLTTIYEFRKQVRSASMVPLITFIFFCLIAVGIFLFIIPQFVSMFQSVAHELPYVTYIMMQISDILRSRYVFLVFGMLLGAGMMFRSFIKTERGSLLWDSFLLKVPGVGFFIQQSSLAYFLQALAMLGGGGMPLVPSLAIAREMISNKVIKQHIDLIMGDVEAGSSLSQAMIHDPGQIFGPEAIAIIRVGEESGRLTLLLGRTAQAYQERVRKAIATLTALINPLLMIVLGLLITFLIFAVYLPIFNLSNVF